MVSTAVVVGAGLAGLASARVLADHAERVVVIDADEPVDPHRARRGVPQSAHPHTLLVAGQQVLEELFPGLVDELLAAGASRFDTGAEMHFYRGSLWPRVPTGVQILTLTRPLLEAAVRGRVAALPNVAFRHGVAVRGLTGTPDAVDGVRLDSGGETVPAGLVVDCTGRGTRSDRWLRDLGCRAPEVDEVKIDVAYATCVLRRLPGDLPTGRAVYVLPAAPVQKRVGLAVPVEGERWQILLAGNHGEHPPRDVAGFHDFARSLPHPGIADLLARAEPLSDIEGFRFPSARWRRFDRMKDVPAGFVAVGDTVASFNPVYGQGMTAALLQARTLGTTLARHRGASPAMVRDQHRAAAKLVSVPWRFATGVDFVYPETVGVRPPGQNLVTRLSNAVQRAALTDITVRRTFARVQHLITPSSALVSPSLLARVLVAARRR